MGNKQQREKMQEKKTEQFAVSEHTHTHTHRMMKFALHGHAKRRGQRAHSLTHLRE